MQGVTVNIADLANLSLLKPPAALQRKLEGALLVTSERMPADIVTMQCRMLVCELATGRRRVISLVYPAEADAASSRISVFEPLGAELLGATVGDVVVLRFGKPGDLKLVEILYQPERDLRDDLVVRDDPA